MQSPTSVAGYKLVAYLAAQAQSENTSWTLGTYKRRNALYTTSVLANNCSHNWKLVRIMQIFETIRSKSIKLFRPAHYDEAIITWLKIRWHSSPDNGRRQFPKVRFNPVTYRFLWGSGWMRFQILSTERALTCYRERHSENNSVQPTPAGCSFHREGML